MNTKFLQNIMDNLAKKNLIFTNEFDFQFALARELLAEPSVKDVKFECLSLNMSWSTVTSTAKKGGKIGANSRQYTDLIVEETNGEFYALELKYRTANHVCTYSNTKYGNVVTMNQGARNLGAYSFWADVQKLEDINNRQFYSKINIKKSYAIFLTNFADYKNSFKSGSIWENYSIQDGKTQSSGAMFFNGNNPDKHVLSSKNYNALTLRHNYTLKWHDYNVQSAPQEFFYLIVEVI